MKATDLMNVVAAIGRRLGKVREEPKEPDRFAKAPAFSRHPQQPRVANLYGGGGSGGAGQAGGDGSVSIVSFYGSGGGGAGGTCSPNQAQGGTGGGAGYRQAVRIIG